MKIVAVSLAAFCLFASLAFPTKALAYHDDRDYDRYGYVDRHPYVKKALIGGGLGAVAGGLVASRGNKTNGALTGALLGSTLGLGYQYLTDDNQRGDRGYRQARYNDGYHHNRGRHYGHYKPCARSSRYSW